MTTTTPTSGAAIQRYKIGYRADEWGQRSSTPSGIPDASGSWVRYADHVTTLAAGQATAAPVPVLHLVHSAFAEIAMAFPKAFALHKVGIADTAVREALAAPAPAAVAGPVVNRTTVIEWLDANDIEVTDRQMDGLFHFAAPTTQPAPVAVPDEIDRLRAALVYVAFALHDTRQYMLAEGITLIDGDTVRVSRDGWTVEASSNPLHQPEPKPSPTAQGDALDAACQRACMELPEGMSIAIQLERHAGWIELHDSDGEQIELPNADGSLAEQMHEAVNAARAAQEGK